MSKFKLRNEFGEWVEISKQSNIDELSEVSKTGSYNDLLDKPFIPESINIYQTTGENTDGPMSQKSTTEELNNKLNVENPTGTGSFSLNRKADTAVGDYSFAEGYQNEASGVRSHAEGLNTSAKKSSSHAEGEDTVANGIASHAEGDETTTNAIGSHAEGYNTLASSSYQHVQGKYNVEDTDDVYADIVGNGTSNANRSNASALDWDGNLHLMGNVFVGCEADSSGGHNVANDYRLQDFTFLTGTIDFDDYSTAGNYTVTGIRTLVNGPSDLGNSEVFVLRVLYLTSTWQTQIVEVLSGEKYQRYHNANGWSGWFRTMSSNKPEFTTESFEMDNVTIAHGDYKEFVFNIAKSGYTPIGIIRVNISNASESGTLNTWCVLNDYHLTATQTSIVYRNIHESTDAKVKLQCTVLYQRN